MAHGNAISKCVYFIAICHYLTGPWYDQQCPQKAIGDVWGYLLTLQIHTQGKTWHTSSRKNGSRKLKTKLPPNKFCSQDFIMKLSCHEHACNITGPLLTHRWSVDSPWRRSAMVSFDVFFVAGLTKLLNKQTIEMLVMPWYSNDLIVISEG